MYSRGSVHLLTFVLFAALLGTPGCAAAISPLEIDAAQTAARVKTALVNDPIVGVRVIDVRVRAGAVRLSGRVASPDEARRAVEIARGVPGVSQVDSRLQVGGASPEAFPEDDSRADAARGPAYEFAELEDEPGGFAIGGSIGLNNPRGRAAGARVSISPLVRLGSGGGLGPAVAFDWFDAAPIAPPDAVGDVGRVRVRPVMAGVRYTLPLGRLSLSPSLVGGYAFNSLRVAETGAVERLSVGVANSFAWRPGVSIWVESGRRTAIHLSVGRVMTSPRFTVVEGGRLRERSLSADATILQIGLAYKVF
ncbi:MAG: BON domain-containing protein [Acidobacteria bacterium]|nr:BON domain-containing protein [Acidobacteriota bacterium]